MVDLSIISFYLVWMMRITALFGTNYGHLCL